MGVIPVGADLIRDEAIDIFLPRQHRILGHAGHAVDTIGHIQSVPVQGRTIDDVRVPQDDLDQIALDGLDGRSGGGAVQGEARQGAPIGQVHQSLPGDEFDPHVRRAHGVDHEPGDRYSGVPGWGARCAVRAVARVSTRGGFGPAAPIGRTHRHGREMTREPAGRPPDADCGQQDHDDADGTESAEPMGDRTNGGRGTPEEAPPAAGMLVVRHVAVRTRAR